MSARPSLAERYLHSPARFVAEREIAEFLAGPARGRRAWDLGVGVPPLAADPGRALATLDRDLAARPDVVADLESLPFASGALQAALLVAVLEHVDRPARVLGEIARVLAAGAPLYVWVPFLHEVHLYPVDRWRFTPDGIRELLEDAGFVTEHVGPGKLAGVGAVAAHLYRFLWPPTAPLLGLKRAGFACVERLAWLDRLAPARAWPIGTTWIGRRAG
ncbi:MAG: methyltransferase domain-containing protein [bacterium]